MTDEQKAALVAASGIALARVGIGVAATLLPQSVSRAQFGSTTPAQTITVRMLGARDLALGLGALLGTNGDMAVLRAWIQAGVLADTIDAWSFVRADRGDARSRALTIAAAAGAAAVGLWAADALSDG